MTNVDSITVPVLLSVTRAGIGIRYKNFCLKIESVIVILASKPSYL